MYVANRKNSEISLWQMGAEILGGSSANRKYWRESGLPGLLPGCRHPEAIRDMSQWRIQTWTSDQHVCTEDFPGNTLTRA